MTAIASVKRGSARIANAVTGAGRRGGSRIQNAIAGYNVYVGTDALPDLTAPPEAFSATLPIAVPITPPGAGTTDFYVIVRKQDHYGLESQNQQAQIIVVDDTGALVRPPIKQPVDVEVFVADNATAIKINAHYPTVGVDAYPANKWRLWVATSPPSVADPTTAQVDVNGTDVQIKVSPYSASTQYVMIALYRTTDGAVSPTVTTLLVIPAAPAKPSPVPSGYQV